MSELKMKLDFKSVNQTSNLLEELAKFHLGFLVFFFFSSFGLLDHVVLTSQVQSILEVWCVRPCGWCLLL